MNRIAKFDAQAYQAVHTDDEVVYGTEAGEAERAAASVARRLMELARQVRHYAATYPALFADAEDEPGRRRHGQCLDATRRLAATMENLWALAENTPGLARLNLEQLEAHMADIRARVAALPT